MMFVAEAAVDDVWQRVAKATYEGRLGVSSKVAACKPTASEVSTAGVVFVNGGGGLVSNEQRVICIYIADFRDKSEMRRVACALKELGDGFRLASGFKPDVFTEIGLFANGQYKLAPTIDQELIREVQEGGPRQQQLSLAPAMGGTEPAKKRQRTER